MFNIDYSEEEIEEIINENQDSFDFKTGFNDGKMKEVIDEVNIINNKKVNKLSMVIKTDPQAAKRPRATGSGGYIRMYDPDEADKKKLKQEIKEKVGNNFDLITTSTIVNIDFYKRTLKSFTKTEAALAELKIIRPTTRPDIDNYDKFFFDAGHDVLWEDDGCIIQANSNKYYSINPRIEIDIYYLEEWLWVPENVEFTEEDMDLIENVNKVKKHLITYYSKEDLVDNIKELISESDRIKFKNKRAKRFININTPVFMITIKDLNKDEFRKEDKLIQHMTDIIFDEIINKFSEDFVKDNPELFKKDGTINEVTKIIISSIFSMRFELKSNSVYLEYFI